MHLRLLTAITFRFEQDTMTVSQKKTSEGSRREILFLEGRSYRYGKVLASGYERWICSRKPLDPITGKYCKGSAKKLPSDSVLTAYIVHDPWCQEVECDEEVGLNLSSDDTELIKFL
jgi:hypothetical protein